jgi:predicted P-loop ATPase
MELIWNFNTSGNTENDDQALGLSVIPVASNKVPFKPWAEYQKKIAPISLWHTHFLNQGTVGIITGKVSGNLECIDIDIKNDPNKTIITEFSDLIPNELLHRLIIQSTPSGGQHYIYRCPEAIIDKNLKLALHSDKTVILETRGEGGYFCTSKINNKIMQGKFNLENLDVDIPIITPKERDFLLETARSLNRHCPSKNDKLSKTDKPFAYHESAINEFNNKYSPLDLFIKHGWFIVREDEQKYYLLRSGSSAQHSGYYNKVSKTFTCFSTSTDFKPEKPYNHFQILEVLEGKNDYKTTLRLLPALGFPVKITSDKITADSIAEYLNELGVRYDSFIQDITINGKVIEELDYNTLYINLKKHFEKEIARTRFEEIIKSRYITTINPIQDFIEANKDRHPAGTFEQWLDCLVLRNKTIDKSVVIRFLKKWYVGMIAQALDGDYPNEFFLTILSIQQGIGKTTFLRNYVLPKELQGYRREHSLSFDDDFKVLMAQALLIVDDEMDSRTYEMDKTFKTVLSTKELTTRRKYDRRISTIKRRCSFAGSGNNLAVVREQQNRRVLPIEIESIDREKLSQVDLTDLFMEAYHLFADGFKYSFQHEDLHLLKHMYEDYIQKSDVDLILDEYLQLPETIGDRFPITNLDLVSSLAGKFPQFSKRINVPTIGKLMAERGYEAVRKGKSRISCYIISKHSKILGLLDNDAPTWHLMFEPLIDEVYKNNINKKNT